MTIHEPRLLDALESLGATSYQGVVWRHMFNEYPPELANTRGARWNPSGVAAVYASTLGETAIAEAQHAMDIQPLRPRPRRRVLYELRVSLAQVVDLTGGHHATVGLSDQDLVSDDFTACQAVGGAVVWLGYDGLLVPSARADGSNIVILVDALAAETHFERVAENELDSEGRPIEL